MYPAGKPVRVSIWGKYKLLSLLELVQHLEDLGLVLTRNGSTVVPVHNLGGMLGTVMVMAGPKPTWQVDRQIGAV